MIPLKYNLRSLAVRKTTSVATALGIALVVFVLASALMLSAGIKRTLATGGHARTSPSSCARAATPSCRAASRTSNVSLVAAARGRARRRTMRRGEADRGPRHGEARRRGRDQRAGPRRHRRRCARASPRGEGRRGRRPPGRRRRGDGRQAHRRPVQGPRPRPDLRAPQEPPREGGRRLRGRRLVERVRGVVRPRHPPQRLRPRGLRLLGAGAARLAGRVRRLQGRDGERQAVRLPGAARDRLPREAVRKSRALRSSACSAR